MIQNYSIQITFFVVCTELVVVCMTIADWIIIITFLKELLFSITKYIPERLFKYLSEMHLTSLRVWDCLWVAYLPSDFTNRWVSSLRPIHPSVSCFVIFPSLIMFCCAEVQSSIKWLCACTSRSVNARNGRKSFITTACLLPFSCGVCVWSPDQTSPAHDTHTRTRTHTTRGEPFWYRKQDVLEFPITKNFHCWRRE